jgi:hypothetical protein
MRKNLPQLRYFALVRDKRDDGIMMTIIACQLASSLARWHYLSPARQVFSALPSCGRASSPLDSKFCIFLSRMAALNMDTILKPWE